MVSVVGTSALYTWYRRFVRLVQKPCTASTDALYCWYKAFVSVGWQFYQSVAEVDGAVGDLGEGFVVGDNDESLAELVAQVEEELVEFGLVLGVEGAGRLVG